MSILLLTILGALGEALINISSLMIDSLSIAQPIVTGIVLSMYPINGGYFLLSMTPFMILFVGIALLNRYDIEDTIVYHQIFILLWLIVLIYFTTIVWALAVPFFLMGKGLGGGPIKIFIFFVDFIIILGVVILFIRNTRKQDNINV